MNEALRARLAEIDAQPAENLTRGAAASLAAAEAMDDGTAENINDYIARKTPGRCSAFWGSGVGLIFCECIRNSTIYKRVCRFPQGGGASLYNGFLPFR